MIRPRIAWAVFGVTALGAALWLLTPIAGDHGHGPMERAEISARRTANHVLVALSIYASSHGGNLPSRTDWRSEALSNGAQKVEVEQFQYTFDPKAAVRRGHPGNDEVGYVSTPYGRAVARDNWEVYWVPQPK